MFSFIKMWLFRSLTTPKRSRALSQRHVIRWFKQAVWFESIVRELNITSAHRSQSEILIGVQYLTNRLHDTAFFVLLTKIFLNTNKEIDHL